MFLSVIIITHRILYVLLYRITFPPQSLSLLIQPKEMHPRHKPLYCHTHIFGIDNCRLNITKFAIRMQTIFKGFPVSPCYRSIFLLFQQSMIHAQGQGIATKGSAYGFFWRVTFGIQQAVMPSVTQLLKVGDVLPGLLCFLLFVTESIQQQQRTHSHPYPCEYSYPTFIIVPYSNQNSLHYFSQSM